MDSTGGSSAGASETAGKAVGAAGSETTGAAIAGLEVVAGGKLVDGMLVEGNDGGLPSPAATARLRSGRAGKLAGAAVEAAGAGASGSHAGLSGAVVGKDGAGATTSLEALVLGNGGLSEMLPRRGLAPPVSGSDGTLSAV